MKARELMTQNPQSVTRQDSLQRAAQIMRDTDTGFVPVVDSTQGMRLEGVITDRDIAVRHVAEGHTGECRVEEAMSKGELRFCSPDDSDKDVMEAMKSAQVRRIPVVENDRLVGVISQADLALQGSDRKTGDTVEKISEPTGRPRG
jgi:CBS domain-containing protein